VRVAIVGASGGIGSALLRSLASRDDVDNIAATYFTTPPASQQAMAKQADGRIHWSKLDAGNEAEIAIWSKNLGPLDWLINCVGMLHTDEQGPEKSIRTFSPEHFAHSMASNCLPTLLLAKHVHAAFKKSDNAVFATVSARVGSISDNRLGGWYSYRSSKAALNMALKCLSIEWARNSGKVRVIAIHPGTTDTALSKPFQANVPTEKLFSTDKTARLLIEQLEQAQHHPSGRFIAYDGEEIVW